MVRTRSCAASLAAPQPEITPIAAHTGVDRTPHASAPALTPPSSVADTYERRRDERIRENLERLQMLGIANLAFKLKSDRTKAPSAKRAYTRSVKNPSPALPRRRSSRLQNVAAVSYSETEGQEKRRRGMNRSLVLEEGAKEEVYTKEHDKLLGRYEKEWELFVDGYGKDGFRIYDPVKGKTCHQCRQKTLGHRTSCSKCDLVQGQFCGDCLFMRYGENVLEANKNPDWVCPVCRGICNCSLCRVKKGWAPTGPLYRRVKGLGFNSVAHYLIQTKRAEEMMERPAKRSLTFKGDESCLSKEVSITELKSEQPATKKELKEENQGSPHHCITVTNNGEVGSADPSENVSPMEISIVLEIQV